MAPYSMDLRTRGGRAVGGPRHMHVADRASAPARGCVDAGRLAARRRASQSYVALTPGINRSGSARSHVAPPEWLERNFPHTAL